MAQDNAQMADRIRGAIWGLLIADALSMPVHWYYDVGSLKREFGEITDFQAPRTKHPSSIMPLSSTGGHGRGGQQGRIIGDVINHGKHEFWGVPNMHYHQGMKAGENTLNALCARMVARGIAAQGGVYSAERFLKDYVAFMTTPGSHNDTYAESFHRDFFKNYAAGVPPEQCSRGTEGHNTAQIGGFVMLPPVILATLATSGSPQAAKEAALTHLKLTHESRKLWGYAEQYSELISDVAAGGDLREAVRRQAAKHRLDLDAILDKGWDDVNVVHGKFGSACYIDDSFPSMLYLAYKYADAFDKAVLANTNVGGENCHRGAALGALMGAALGESAIPPRFIEGLHDSAAIRQEIDAFIVALSTGGAGGAAAPAGAAAGKAEL